jgi:DNA polymerase-3 subunit delta'
LVLAVKLAPELAELGWDRVVGQQRVVEQLKHFVGQPIHAFLFVGAPGVGVEEAASVFAAHVVAVASASPQDALRRALDNVHPDIARVQRVGAKILRDQVVDDVVKAAMMTPLEGGRRVLIVEDMHLLDEAARSALLKTVEEPPPGTVFVLCAEDTPAELATISSRCVTVEFAPLAQQVIIDQLRRDGVAESSIASIAVAAAGRLDRARLLAADPTSLHRFELWQGVASTLQRSGSSVFGLVDELLASVEPVLAPIEARHKADILAERDLEKEFGVKKTAKAEAEKARKRELRRARTDEIRSGFAALSMVYRDRLLSAGSDREMTSALGSLDALARAQEAMRFNPNERLLLAGLLTRLARVNA